MLKRQSIMFVFCSILFFANTCFAAGINWHNYSSSVFDQAKKQNKLVLIFGKAEWCHWCQQMKKEVYTNDDVIQQVNSHYIAVYVDIDNDAAVANHYQISGVPTTIIMNGDRQVLKSESGYLSASELSSLLSNAAS